MQQTPVAESTGSSESTFNSSESLYRKYVNPEWARLITVLGLNKSFVRSLGTELFTDDNQVYLDFLAGYGVYNIGHNHPYVAQELIRELQSQRPSMLQSHIPPRGESILWKFRLRRS